MKEQYFVRRFFHGIQERQWTATKRSYEDNIRQVAKIAYRRTTNHQHHYCKGRNFGWEAEEAAIRCTEEHFIGSLQEFIQQLY